LAHEGACFDLILADPPFGEKNVGRRSTSLSQRLLDNEHLPRLMTPDGLLILGHSRRDQLTFPARWAQVKEMKHGDSMMEFLRPAANPAQEGKGDGEGEGAAEAAPSS
jgi:16S rRNA G966 N2-methylase RsmD